LLAVALVGVVIVLSATYADQRRQAAIADTESQAAPVLLPAQVRVRPGTRRE
jgi:hypothetical protein